MTKLRRQLTVCRKCVHCRLYKFDACNLIVCDLTITETQKENTHDIPRKFSKARRAWFETRFVPEACMNERYTMLIKLEEL